MRDGQVEESREGCDTTDSEETPLTPAVPNGVSLFQSEPTLSHESDLYKTQPPESGGLGRGETTGGPYSR